MPSMLKSLKLLSDPTRLRILKLVENEALSVAELQEVLGMGQSRISTQLSLLKAEGLVAWYQWLRQRSHQQVFSLFRSGDVIVYHGAMVVG